MITLKHDDYVRSASWTEGRAARVVTIRGRAAKQGQDPEWVVSRRQSDDTPLVQSLWLGGALPGYRNVAGAIVLKSGDVVAVEGEPLTYRVAFADGCEFGEKPASAWPVVFTPVVGG